MFETEEYVNYGKYIVGQTKYVVRRNITFLDVISICTDYSEFVIVCYYLFSCLSILKTLSILM